MKTLKLNTILLLFCIFSMSCGKKNSPATDDGTPTGDTELSIAATQFLDKLKSSANTGNIFVGHQATTIAGVGWRLSAQNPDYSDFKAVSGKFPAVYGWEFACPPNDQNITYDYVSYDATIQEAIKAYKRGGINTFGIHPYRLDNNGGSWDNTPGYLARLLPSGNLHSQYKAVLDKYITQFKKLKDDNGNPIPFIFRPYHEANHNWFWWGSTACTDDEFKTFFRFTITYMRSNGLNNMLVCYAPGYFQHAGTYHARYPGDDVVDLLGFDGYYGNNNGHGTDWNTLKNHLLLLKEVSESKGKPAVWAETGEKVVYTPDFFTRLDQTIQSSGIKLAYLMFWANYEAAEFYVPYNAQYAPTLKADFNQFINKQKYLVEGEYNTLYN